MKTNTSNSFIFRDVFNCYLFESYYKRINDLGLYIAKESQLQQIMFDIDKIWMLTALDFDKCTRFLKYVFLVIIFWSSIFSISSTSSIFFLETELVCTSLTEIDSENNADGVKINARIFKATLI